MKRVLVSACLLGVGCRYDGKQKRCEQVCALMEQMQLVPVCPEILGGLPTPRSPSERQGERVVSNAGVDVTEQYRRGAQETLRLAQLYGCDCAILKARSPSCGCGEIYDGAFGGSLTEGDGVTAELLKRNGIRVVTENDL